MQVFCRGAGCSNSRLHAVDADRLERASLRGLTDRKVEITRQPARLKPGFGKRAECPAVRASQSDPAVAVAFFADDDRADAARREAKDQNGTSSSKSRPPLRLRSDERALVV